MAEPYDEAPPLDDVVTHMELAEFLGISERSLSYYRIPSIDMGGRKFYFKSSVARWLKVREQKGRVNPDRA